MTSRTMAVLPFLVVASLLAFGAVADRALEGQARRAAEAAALRAEETARLTAASVRAALARLEQEVLAGQAPDGVAAERLAVPPLSMPRVSGIPYRHRSRDELAKMLHSRASTSSGLPVAVVARLALGDAAFSLPGGAAPPDVRELLLDGTLPVRPEDLPVLARALGVGDDPRVGRLQERLRSAPDADVLPVLPAFRRTRVGSGVEGWGRDRVETVRYVVSLDRLLVLAGVAERAAPAPAGRTPYSGTPEVNSGVPPSARSLRDRRGVRQRVAVPETAGLLLDVNVTAPETLRLRRLRLALWLAVAASILCLAAVRRALAAEARANAREKAFLAGVTHELRTPLTAIRLFGETLAEGRGEPREYGELVAQESRRLEALVEQVLAATRVEAAPVFASVQPADLVRSAVALIAPRAERRAVTLEVRAAAELPGAFWDGEAVRRAVLNLLDNAIRHGRAAGRVEVRAEAQGGEVSVSVSDDGPGIGRRERRGLFRRFARGEGESAGSGLGLHLVQAVAQAHGGRIDLATEEGRGSTFTLRLPCRPPRRGNG
jgi:signal transduction histidine kinase